MRREEGANAGPIGAERGIERAVAADEVVAEGQLGIPRGLVADDEVVAGGDELARAEGADNLPAGFRAGAHEDAGVGYVVATGHLAPGNHKVNALAGARNLSGGAGTAAEVCFVAGHGALGGIAEARHRVVVELAIGRTEHAIPLLGAEPAVIQVEVVGMRSFFWPRPARFRLWAPGGQRMTKMGGSTELTYSSTTAELKS